MPCSSIAIITYLPEGELEYLADASKSIIQAASQVDYPVSWNIAYSTDNYQSYRLDAVKDLTDIDVNIISTPGPLDHATGINLAISQAEKNSMLVHCGAKDMLTEDRLTLLNMEADNAVSLCAVDHLLDDQIYHSDRLRGCIKEYPWWEKCLSDNSHQLEYNLVSWSIPYKLAIKAGGVPGLPLIAEELFIKKVHDFCKVDIMAFPQIGYIQRILPDMQVENPEEKAHLWRSWIEA